MNAVLTQTAARTKVGWRVNPAVRKALRLAAINREESLEDYLERLLIEDLTEKGFLNQPTTPTPSAQSAKS